MYRFLEGSLHHYTHKNPRCYTVYICKIFLAAPFVYVENWKMTTWLLMMMMGMLEAVVVTEKVLRNECNVSSKKDLWKKSWFLELQETHKTCSRSIVVNIRATIKITRKIATSSCWDDTLWIEESRSGVKKTDLYRPKKLRSYGISM